MTAPYHPPVFAFKVNTPYRPAELPAELCAAFGRLPCVFPLPQEVLRFPSKPDPLPCLGRAYRLDLWLIEGWVHSYGYFLALPFRGTSRYEGQRLMLLEVWEDRGDDGHIQYGLDHFIVLPQAEARKQVREMQGHLGLSRPAWYEIDDV